MLRCRTPTRRRPFDSCPRTTTCSSRMTTAAACWTGSSAAGTGCAVRCWSTASSPAPGGRTPGTGRPCSPSTRSRRWRRVTAPRSRRKPNGWPGSLPPTREPARFASAWPMADGSRARRLPWLRRPVRREGAERYLLVTLVSFAGTVILTRWFLALTGFPQIGGGDLHIAHALWGGVALFAAAILPILLAGRFVYVTSALLAGVGIGLFIDEVGKFITAENDYFYPAAAPIIYATFLIAVLVWLRARRPHDPEPRSQLLTALELFEETVESDLQRAERDMLRERLASAAARSPRPEQRRLATDLLAFVEAEELLVAPDPVDRLGGLRAGWRSRADRWLGGRGLRMALIAALLL